MSQVENHFAFFDFSESSPPPYSGPVNGTVNIGNGFDLTFSDELRKGNSEASDDRSLRVSLSYFGDIIDRDTFIVDSDEKNKEKVFQKLASDLISGNWKEMQSFALK